MKKILTVAAIGTFIMMGVAQSNAQDTNTNTFIISGMQQTLTITLTGFTGGQSNVANAATAKITNKEVISSIGAATGATFSPKAKLIALTDTNGNFAILVQDNKVNTDVSGFFNIVTVAGPITKTSGKGGTAWSIDLFSFGSSGADTNGPAATSFSFNVQGFTQSSLANGAFTSQVNGPGTAGNLDAVFKGTIKAGAGKKVTLQ